MQTIKLHTGKKIEVTIIGNVQYCNMARSIIGAHDYGRHYLAAYTLGQANLDIRFEVGIEYIDKNNKHMYIYDAVKDFTTRSEYLKSIGYAEI